MEDTIKMFNVEMHINARKHPPSRKGWDVSMESNINITIDKPIFQFNSPSMNTAVTKIGDLVARHPEFYFKEIHIK